MMKKKWISLLLIFGLLLGMFLPADGWSAQAAEDTPEQLLAGMTTEEKLCQMIMVSFRKFQDEEDPTKQKDVLVLPEKLSECFSKYNFGSYILYGNNFETTEQTIRLIDSIRKTGKGSIQPLISTDQEGGSVTRLEEGVEGPGNMALAATGSSEDVSTIAKIMGTEVAAVDIDVSFCPDSDVNNNPGNPVIGIRSFSDDPETVAEDVILMQKGLQEAGVISCLKHFPGHGDTQTDSHTGFPRIDKTYEQLKSLELIPFCRAIEAGTEMVMTAHIMYPEIDDTEYTSKHNEEKVYLPATLSKKILTGILRGDLGYDGLIISDAMEMDAIAKYFSTEDAMVLAIGAGVNIMMMPAPLTTEAQIAEFDTLLQSVVAKVEADESLMQNVDDSVLRILKLKQEHGRLTAYDDSDLESRIAKAKTVVSTKANHETEWEITKRAVTLLKNENNTLPLTREGEKTVIITAWDDEPFPMEYALDLVRQEGKLPKNSTFEVHCLRTTEIEGQTGSPSEDEVLGWLSGADNVIAVSEMSSLGYMTRWDATLVDSILARTHELGGRFILMSVKLPYDVALYPDADAVVLTYGCRAMAVDPRTSGEPVKQYGPNMAAGLYMILQTEQDTTGKLPVNLPKVTADRKGFTSELLYERGRGLSLLDCTVTFVADGKTVKEATARKGKQLEKNLIPEDPEKEGYVFLGWKYEDGYLGEELPVISGDITFTADFEKEAEPVTPAKVSWKKYSGGYRYVDADGNYPKKCWKKIDGKWYYFDKYGFREYSAYRDGYRLDKNGVRTSDTKAPGWKTTKKGKRFYVQKGKFVKNCWRQIDGNRYYFDKNGYIETNAYRKCRYLTRTGAWDGKTVPGWKTTKKGKRYSLGNGKYLKSGWKKIGGNTYYFDKNGYIITSAFVKGKWLSKAGVCSPKYNASWHKTTKGWWYGNKTGWRAKGKTYTIDGKKYKFNRNGYCTNR